ncbi:MAG TPA: sulfite exporter TauE/SafE family protein [Acidobacteriota bacterium]|nr:sulfite exporter TauE/SafE family protein [Acidobacteriota bacterium]
MSDYLLYVICGLTAGVLGGYLGLGGGIVMVPFLTVATGLDMKTAIPVSVAAIVVNSIASSTEYLRRGMVDLELVVVLTIFMAMGNITGSILSSYVPTDLLRLMFTAVLLYTAFAFLKGRQPSERMTFQDSRKRYLLLCSALIYVAGTLAGMIGIGGGVIIIPLLFLIVGLPLTTARGTSAFLIGFSAAAATAVYFLSGRLDPAVVSPVILGIIFGGKIGGYFGTLAKPFVVKILFFVTMLYLAFRLAWEPLAGLL